MNHNARDFINKIVYGLNDTEQLMVRIEDMCGNQLIPYGMEHGVVVKIATYADLYTPLPSS